MDTKWIQNGHRNGTHYLARLRMFPNELLVPGSFLVTIPGPILGPLGAPGPGRIRSLNIVYIYIHDMELFGPLGPPGPRNRVAPNWTNFPQFPVKMEDFHGKLLFLPKSWSAEHTSVPGARNLCYTNAFSMILGGYFWRFS